MRSFFLSAFIIFICDQLAKIWALATLAQPIIVIPGFFSLQLVFNTGSIWGMGSQWTYGLAWLGVVVVLFLPFYLRKHAPSRYQWILLGILCGGILGNTLDRFLRGYVVDFLDFYVKNSHWPCFNIADIAITSICILSLFRFKSKKI